MPPRRRTGPPPSRYGAVCVLFPETPGVVRDTCLQNRQAGPDRYGTMRHVVAKSSLAVDGAVDSSICEPTHAKTGCLPSCWSRRSSEVGPAGVASRAEVGRSRRRRQPNPARGPDSGRPATKPTTARDVAGADARDAWSAALRPVWGPKRRYARTGAARRAPAGNGSRHKSSARMSCLPRLHARKPV